LAEDVAVVENVDVFTPIHDDPHIQGKIVACNATNDVFAMGATEIVSLQAFLAYPPELPEEIVVGVLKGMDEFMRGLGAVVTGGQTISNPCPVFGGICMGVLRPDQIIHSSTAHVGDAVVLTKPLGIQPAMRSYRDLQSDKREALLSRFRIEDLERMIDNAVRIMTTSNLEVAMAMREVGVHAATDVTGFGLLGHAGNVARLSRVGVVIDTVPVIAGTLKLADFYGHRLSQGLGAETAGGMLVFMDPARVSGFKKRLSEKGLPCWKVGSVVQPKGSFSVELAEKMKYIETEFP
jgi:selenide,water dikinase